MKKRRFGLLFAVAALIAVMLLGTVCSAENFVFTQHKVVLTHYSEENTIYADIYISKGSALMGYCSFTYDSSVLQLKDIYSNPVTAGNIPEFGVNGNIYLSDIITGHSGIVITDIGKGTSTLINPEEGCIMFAWFLPDSIECIQATEDNEVLLASFSFDITGDISYEDFDKDTFWVADNELTDKVKGWFPGIVVLNAEQHQFNFDGTVEDGDLFVLEYQLDSLMTENEKPKDEPKEEPDEEPEELPTAEPEKEPVINPDDEPKNEPEVEQEVEPEVKPEEVEPEVEQEDIPAEEPETQPEDELVEAPAVTPGEDENEEPEEDSDSPFLNKNSSFKADFNLSCTASDTSINLSWKAPSGLKKISNYTAVLCDSNYNVISSVDIFNASTSYTFKGLKDGFDYKLYFYANISDKTYCSNVLSITTEISKDPDPIILTVTYNAGRGSLYGLKSEQVLFGEYITKQPAVTPPEGKYFLGWSNDGKNLFDTSSRIYKNTKLTALYSDTPKAAPNAYITGYLDGTFKPDGNITRAEAAVLISRISPLFKADTLYTHSFSDCESGAWYENAVAFCSSNGFITGYLNGTFNPTGKITRAEFATILVRVFGFEDSTEINVFSDIESHWACPYISRLFCAGIITPSLDGQFNPSSLLTRKDAVLLLNACLGIKPDVNAINNYLFANGYKFSDVEQYKDYFYPIMAATLKAEDYTY